MILPENLADLFFETRYDLLWGINDKHKVIKGFDKPSEGTHIWRSLSDEQLQKVREALWENPQWISEYLADRQDATLTKEKRDIIRDWREYFIKDTFIVVKHLRRYSVFMHLTDTVTLYGVCGLSCSIEDIVPDVPPFIIDAVLLPFKDRIVHDGIIAVTPRIFEPQMRFRTLEHYNAIKDEFGIIERLNGENLSVKTSEFKIPKKNKSRRRRRR